MIYFYLNGSNILQLRVGLVRMWQLRQKEVAHQLAKEFTRNFYKGRVRVGVTPS